MGMPSKSALQRLRVLQAGVEALDGHVGDHRPLAPHGGVLADGLDQLRQRVRLLDGQHLQPLLRDGARHRERQPVGVPLAHVALNGRHEPRGGEGDGLAPRWRSPRGARGCAAARMRLGVVEQRLAHAHEHHAAHRPVRLGADLQHLVENLPGRRLRWKPSLPGHAEVARERAAHLAGDADHVLVVEDGDAHRLHASAQRRGEEVLHEAVIRLAPLHHLEPGQLRVLAQEVAPRAWAPGAPDTPPRCSWRRGRRRRRTPCAPPRARARTGASAGSSSGSDSDWRANSRGGLDRASAEVSELGGHLLGHLLRQGPACTGPAWRGRCAGSPRTGSSPRGVPADAWLSSGDSSPSRRFEQEVDGVFTRVHPNLGRGLPRHSGRCPALRWVSLSVPP